MRGEFSGDVVQKIEYQKNLVISEKATKTRCGICTKRRSSIVKWDQSITK
jgi:hypothetical protein